MATMNEMREWAGEDQAKIQRLEDALLDGIGRLDEMSMKVQQQIDEIEHMLLPKGGYASW